MTVDTTLALFLVTRLVKLVAVGCMNPFEVEILLSSPDNGRFRIALGFLVLCISEDWSVALTSVASEVERRLTVGRCGVLFSHVESLVAVDSDVDQRRF